MTEAKPMPVVVANWKCNGVKRSIYALISSWDKQDFTHDVECYIACPSIYIPFLQSVFKHRDFEVAAQNCVASPGAFTGEICVDQLIDSNVNTVIIGHSERRKHFAESEKVIGEKCYACVSSGLRIVVCIGEGLGERQKGLTKEVVEIQLQTVIRAVPQRYWDRVVIAYEPIWAIGTGKVASPTDVQDIHRFIRERIASTISPEVSRKVRILYGGSVTSKTAEPMYQMPDVNGFLVGGASLTQDFLEIIQATRS